MTIFTTKRLLKISNSGYGFIIPRRHLADREGGTLHVGRKYTISIQDIDPPKASEVSQ